MVAKQKSKKEAVCDKSRKRGRLYVGVVVTLATFLMGLAWVRPAKQSVVVTAVVSREIGPLLSPPSVTLDTAFLQRVFQGFPDDTVPDFPSWMSSTGSRLKFEERAGSQASETHYAFRLDDEDQEKSRAVLESVVQQFITEHHHPVAGNQDASQRAAVEQTVSERRDAVDQLRRTVDSYVRTELANRREQFSEEKLSNQASGPVVSSTSDQPGLPVVQQPNPVWQEVELRLTQLEEDRKVLLRTLTLSHPLVLNLDHDIRQLKLQLSSTPRLVNQSGQIQTNPTVRPTDFDSRPAHKFDVLAARAQIEQSDEYAEFQRQISAAEDELEQAQAQLAAHPLPTDTLPIEARVVQPPTVTRIPTADITGKHIGLLGGVALLAGGLLAWLGAVCKPTVVFTSAQDVEDELSLPVVAVLETRDGPALPPPPLPTLRRSAWLVTFACELVLVGVTALMIYSTVVHKEFAGQFAKDPFGAYIEAIDDVTSFVRQQELEA